MVNFPSREYYILLKSSTMSLAIFSIPNLQPPTKPQSLRLPSIFVSLKHGNMREIVNCLSYLDPRRLTPTGVHCRKKTSRNNRHFTIIQQFTIILQTSSQLNKFLSIT